MTSSLEVDEMAAPARVTTTAQRPSCAVWVEQIGWTGRVSKRQRFEALPVWIGSGYDNHLMLDDPAVAPQHLMIAAKAGGELTAAGRFDNQFRFEGEPTPLARSRLRAEDVICIGNTRLRIVREGDTSPLPAPSTPQCPGGWAWTVVVLCWLIAAAVIWLTDLGRGVKPDEPWSDLWAIADGAPYALGWIVAWTLASRTVGGRWLPRTHVLIGSVGVLLAVVLPRAVPVVAYQAQWQPAAAFYQGILWMFVAAATAAVHLQVLQAGNGIRRRWWLLVGLVPLALLAWHAVPPLYRVWQSELRAPSLHRAPPAALSPLVRVRPASDVAETLAPLKPLMDASAQEPFRPDAD